MIMGLWCQEGSAFIEAHTIDFDSGKVHTDYSVSIITLKACIFSIVFKRIQCKFYIIYKRRRDNDILKLNRMVK